jgi:uncharacterized protein with PQ loop repeat
LGSLLGAAEASVRNASATAVSSKSIGTVKVPGSAHVQPDTTKHNRSARHGATHENSGIFAFLQPHGNRSLNSSVPALDGSRANISRGLNASARRTNVIQHISASTPTPIQDSTQGESNQVSFLDDGLEDFVPLGTSFLFTSDARVGGARNGLHAGAAEGRGHGLHLGNSTLSADAAKKQKLTPQSWFAITFSFAFVVKCLCMLSNVVFQVSPLPQVLKFNKQGDTFETDAAPFMSIMYGGCQWCFYGFFAFIVTKKSGFLVLVYSNVMGAFLGGYYIWVFQSNCLSKPLLKKLHMYYRIACAMAVCQLCAMLVLARQRALFFCGLVSSVCSVVGACSLLATLPTILETKSSKTINKPILSAGFLGAVLLALCGFILWDPLIMVPNLICMVFQTFAFSLCLYYPSDGPDTPSATDISPRAALEAGSGLEDRFLRAAVFAPAGAGGAAAASGGDGGPATGATAHRREQAGVRNYGSMSVLGETGGTF